MYSIFPLGALLLLCGCGGDRSRDPQPVQIAQQSAATVRAGGDTVRVDLDRSRVFWKGTKIRGTGKHEGMVRIKDAFLLTEGNRLSGGSFVIDLHSIEVTDIPAHEPVPRKRLNNHLKSADFFNVSKYPTARFDITRVDQFAPDSLRISGDLAIKDVRKNISFTAFHRAGLFRARFTIDRFEWHIGSEANWLERNAVDRPIELRVEIRRK